MIKTNTHRIKPDARKFEANNIISDYIDISILRQG